MPNRILDSLAAGLDDLRTEYEAALPAIHRVVGELHSLRSGLAPGVAATSAPAGAPLEHGPAPEPRPNFAEIEVRDSGISELLALQELLANVPGISRVSLTGMTDGRARMLVELSDNIAVPETADDGGAPTLICAFCSRVLAEGGAGISHGLCEKCAGPFVAAAGGAD